MLDLLEQSPSHGQGVASPELAMRIVAEIWGRNLTRTQQQEARFYLDYYNAKVDALDPGRVSTSKHLDVLAIVKFVKDRQHSKLSQLEDDLVGLRPVPIWLKSPDGTATRQAVEFGASLWLFVDVARWQQDESLFDWAARTFGPAGTLKQSNWGAEIVHFNARSLRHIGGMELVWTSNLC